MRLARWFILLVLASLMGCSNVNSNEVVAIENTGVYRIEGAKSEHLRPCAVCNPDLL